MTVPFFKGRYGVRLASSAADIEACQALRHWCFHGRAGLDADGFDAGSAHVMVADAAGLVATCRVRLFSDPADVHLSYTAQSYDLDKLSSFPGALMEIGRFCVATGAADADALRLIWGALAGMVDTAGVGLMFGCASFKGADAARHAPALTLLADRYIAPSRWSPARRAADVVPLVPGPAQSPAGVPPLLRSYLQMGGWVSDHAVIDRAMDTLHVFTGIEVAAIPPARARALRALAG